MKKINIFEIPGMTLPAGRNTKVFVGPQADITADSFVQGYVTIFPGGGIPAHQHENEETYTILSGSGEMIVDGQTVPVIAGDCVYVTSGQSHELTNTGDGDMVMMFVYSPATIVDHWKQEQDGTLHK